MQIFSDAYKSEGMRGIYRGVLPSTLGALPYAGSAYFVYETLKITHRKQKKREPNPMERMLYGAFAGAAGQTSSYPFDVIRRRMQTAYLLNRGEANMGAAQLVSQILREEGIVKGLFKGLSMNWIKGPIAAGVGFMTYDLLQVFIRRHT